MRPPNTALTLQIKRAQFFLREVRPGFSLCSLSVVSLWWFDTGTNFEGPRTCSRQRRAQEVEVKRTRHNGGGVQCGVTASHNGRCVARRDPASVDLNSSSNTHTCAEIHTRTHKQQKRVHTRTHTNDTHRRRWCKVSRLLPMQPTSSSGPLYSGRPPPPGDRTDGLTTPIIGALVRPGRGER